MGEHIVIVPSSRTFTVPPAYQLPGGSNQTVNGTEFLSVPKNEIPIMAQKYLDAMETGTTEEWCQCKWMIHPDDVDIKAGQCRNCRHLNVDHLETIDDTSFCAHDECPCTDYQSRRVRRMDDEPLCPVHSKQGLILGFFEWVFGAAGRPTPPPEDLRSPNEWLDSEWFNNTVIHDCDGWTYSEWIKQDKITKEEFERRLGKCTTGPKILPAKGPAT